MDALVIVNKKDLGTEGIEAQLDEYRKLQLECIEVSARTGEGVEDAFKDLAARLVAMP